VKPAAFDYARCDSADEAVALLAELGDEARVLAGGQSLIAALNMRLARPRLLADISRAGDLAAVRVDAGALVVGAAVTQAALEGRATLENELPLLALMFPHISHEQVRSRGTVCGSIAYADPSAELPLALAALGGEVVLRSRRGRRQLAADAFFQGMLATAREADELIEEVRFPLRTAGTRYAFTEFAERQGDFAIAAIAVAASPEGIRFAVGGVADRPRVARWPRLAGDELEDAINDFAWELEAGDDAHASAQYRRHLVRRLGRKAVEEACA
jgi:2-furoyl-CoA dehydrogenase FAD binding subunit